MKINNKNTCKILVVFSLVLMITVNALANILPINGIGTGAVSDSFPNLFAPAGITFSIWGLIYILLFVYAIYQTGLFSKEKTNFDLKWLRTVGFLFVLSSMANTIWIFAWHYRMIELSLVMMLIILASLIKIILVLKNQKLSTKEKLLVRMPFSIYFGWITVATIANIVTQLVDWNWNGFGIPEPVWSIIILSVGAVIGIATILSNKDIVYGLVLVWAFTGILIKHFSATGFAGEYTGVIITVIISLAAFVLAIAAVFVMGKRKTELIGM